MQDGPLDMRMDKTQELTADYIINNYKEEELADLIFNYGEEKFARKIAKNICEYRKNKKIETTLELVKIIEKSILKKYNEKFGHPAKRTFQAIRIEVNNEIKPLYNSIINSVDCLKPGGRLCVITFHSLEDRICKNIFSEVTKIDDTLKKLPVIPEEYLPDFKIVKVLEPSKEELERNNRARSAKLRVIEKIK
jgi:16S rRNA (cytosine1402-N4)-methyltransferase